MVKHFICEAFDVQGVLAPVFTPFLESGSIDFSIIPSYMAYLNENHINGILVGGTTGEGMSLSVHERKSLFEAWIAAARPFGTKVIAQVGGAPLPDVLELATHAENLKADGLMTLPELYYKPRTVDQLVCYLQQVSGAASTLPIVYYHFPMMTGVDVSMPKLFQEASKLKLKLKLPNFKGVKADLGVAMEVAHLLREDQKIFIANHHIAPSVLMGHDTSIATVTNLFPVLVHNIVSAVKDSDVVNARVLQKRLNEIVTALAVEGDFVPAMKTAMELVTGIRMGQTRPPLVSFNYEQRSRLKDTLIRLDVKLQDTA
ncbi:N-acetylneuraminate lyase A-like [Helicoverpa zea]|uniref:N-acetylneuraminate lyase A-like n=1 Tax=Helicoverpa zea TaxID=7113 RepID=UPI001F567E36|nr:N-acetylneuraminate lyase A-like [Helicoverpa zea]